MNKSTHTTLKRVGDHVSDPYVRMHGGDPDLKRVTSQIGQRVITFCNRHLGQEVTGLDLDDFVRHGIDCTPGSATRVLRDLRRQGHVRYDVVNRRQSRYKIIAVYYGR